MTPQCSVSMHNTKQPLLTHEPPVNPVIQYSNANKKTKIKRKAKSKIKCVIVGDKAVGKTALVVSYSTHDFPKDYVPTAYDNYNVVVQVDEKPIRLELCDTAGEDGLNPLRSLCYPGTDVFILCFSVAKPASFHSACTRWADELTRQGAAVVLVGTQCDLRQDADALSNLARRRQHPVSESEARILAEQLDAPYIETSAKNFENLKKAFDNAIILALKKNKKRALWRRFCCF